MSLETRTCDFCEQPFSAFGGVEHLPNCPTSSLAIPLALAQIAESLAKIANPLITINAPLSEQEIEKLRHDAWQEGFRTGKEARLFDTLTPVGEFFEHLNKGEVRIQISESMDLIPVEWQFVISPKVGEGK